MFCVYVRENCGAVIVIYNTGLLVQKMSLSRADVRKLLKYEFLRGANASVATDRINKAHGPKTVTERTAHRWFSKFSSGKMDVDDAKRHGRPKIIDRTGVVNAIEEDPTLDSRSLADQFGCSHTAILKILRSEGNSFILCRTNRNSSTFSRQKVDARPLGPA